MSEESRNRDLEVLWTPQQVAKYLGINRITVYRWFSEGKIIDPTKVIRISNRIRIPRSEVERIAGLTRAKLAGESEPK